MDGWGDYIMLSKSALPEHWTVTDGLDRATAGNELEKKFVFVQESLKFYSAVLNQRRVTTKVVSFLKDHFGPLTGVN